MTNIQAINLLKNLEQSLDDYCELNGEGKTAFGMAITALELFGNSEQLPSAQPEKRTEERMETHACDCISRQRAIDAVKRNTFRLTFAEEQNYEGHVAWSAEAVYSDVMEGALLELPPAQPESLTDKEQRIFLSAMGREEMVCKEVDDECCREPYEDTLVEICHEITRKVKGVLWTT